MNTHTTLKILALSSAFLLFAHQSEANQINQPNSPNQQNQHTVPMNLPSQTQIPMTIPKQQFAIMNKSQAEQIALQHAKLTSKQVSSLWVEQDADDGRMEFEVEFKYDGYNYDYKINGNTGQILSHKFEKRRFNLLGALKSSTPENLIQSEYATQIALNHAGLQANQVVMRGISYDFDDGEHLYEIGFSKDYIEYQYEIDAETGEIYQCEVDYHI